MGLTEIKWQVYYGRIDNVHEWLVKPCPAKKKVNTNDLRLDSADKTLAQD